MEINFSFEIHEEKVNKLEVREKIREIISQQIYYD